MNLTKKFAVVAGISMLSTTVLQPFAATFAAVNVMPYSAEKIVNLGITSSTWAMNAPANFASVATFAVRARMILDYRFGYAPATQKLTKVPVWNSALATLDVFGLKGIDKTKALGNVSKADFDNIIRTVFGENFIANVTAPASNSYTKEEALRIIDAIYEAGKAAKFAELGGTTGNNSTGNLKDLINQAINGGDSNSNVNDNNAFVTIAREKLDEIKITPKSGVKLEDLTFEDDKGNKLKPDSNGYVKLTSPEATTIIVKNSKGEKVATVKIPNYGKEGIEVTKDNFDGKIGTWPNVVAKLIVTGEQTFTVKPFGLFNDNSMGNLVILDSNYDRVTSRKIRNQEKITYTSKGSGTKTYYLLAENNNNTAEFNLDIYKGDSTNSGDLLTTKRYDAFQSSNGEANIQLNQTASTMSQDVGLGDKVKISFNIQNMDSKTLILKKLKLDGTGSAEVKSAILKDEKGNELKDYKIETSSRNDILVYLPDGAKGLELEGNETKTVTLELQGFSGYEGDKASYGFANKSYDYLLLTKGSEGKFAKTTVGNFNNSYGTYTIKKSSASVSSSSQSNDNVQIGDNSLVYRFKVETIGKMEVDAGRMIIEPSTGTTISDLKASLRNFQLKYCEGEKSCEGKVNLISTVTMNEQDGKLILTYNAGTTLKGGKYTFELYANVSEALAGKSFTIDIQGADLRFENQDNDRITASGRVKSSALLVKKGSLSFINTNGNSLEVVNTRARLGVLTISNVGGVDTYLRGIKANFTLNGASTDAVSNVYLIETTGSDAIDFNKNLLSSPVRVVNGSADIKLSSPILIKKNTDRRFAVIGEVDGNVMDFTNGVPFRTVFPRGGINTGTNAQATLTNDNDVLSPYITLYANGKVDVFTVGTQANDEGGSVKSIVSPSDGEVLLGKVTVTAKRENVRFSEILLKDRNSSQGIQNIESIKIKTGTKSNDPMIGYATVDSATGKALIQLSDPRDNLKDTEEKLTTINKDKVEGKTYYIYGKMSNSENFVPATAEVIVEKVKLNGLQSGNKVPASDISITNDDIKIVKMYPAVPNITNIYKDKTSSVGANTNTKLAGFTIHNDQAKPIKISKMTFGISGGNNLILKNVTLKQGSDVLARVDTLDLGSENKVTFVPRLGGRPLMLIPGNAKDLTITANVLRKDRESADINFTYYFGDKDNATTEHSFEYCATTDITGNTCVNANTLSPNNVLWFVNSTEKENETSYKAVDINKGGSATISCPATAPAITTTGNVNGMFNNSGKVKFDLSVSDADGLDIPNIPAQVTVTGANGIQTSSVEQSISGNTLSLTFERDGTLKNASDIAGTIKIKLVDKCGNVGAEKTLTMVAPTPKLYGVSFLGTNPAFLNNGTNSMKLYFTGTPTVSVDTVKTVGNTIEFYNGGTKVFTISGEALNLTGGNATYNPLTVSTSGNVMTISYAGGVTTTQMAIDGSKTLTSDNLFPWLTNLAKVTSEVGLANGVNWGYFAN